MAANIRYFLSNYLVIVLVVLAFNVLTHPWVILACSAAVAALFYVSREVSNRNLSFEVAGIRLGAGHLNLAIVAVVSVVLLVLVGEVVFTFVGASSCAVGLHAFLRQSREAEAAMEAVMRARMAQQQRDGQSAAASAPVAGDSSPADSHTPADRALPVDSGSAPDRSPTSSKTEGTYGRRPGSHDSSGEANV